MQSRIRYIEFLAAAALIAFACWDAYHVLSPGPDAKEPSWWGIALTPWMTPALALTLAGLLVAGLSRDFIEKIDRPLEILVALVFLWSAYLKGIKANDFAAQINVYGIEFLKPYLGPVALFTLTLESFLAVGMLLGLRLKMLLLLLAEGMLLFFSCLVAYAWPENCGCMGEVVITPPQAIGKNVVLMTMIAIAWRGFLWEVAMPPSRRGEIIKLLVALAVAAGTLAYAYPQLYQSKPAPNPKPTTTGETKVPNPDEGGPALSTPEPPKPTASSGPYAQYVVETEFGEILDLSQGEYLVASLSMTCEHCKATVPALNELMFRGGLPRLLALCHEPEPDSLELFKLETNPQFPMHPLGSDFLEFSKVIGATPPRLAYVVDGTAVEFWDTDELPLDEIEARVWELQGGAVPEAVDATSGAS